MLIGCLLSEKFLGISWSVFTEVLKASLRLCDPIRNKEPFGVLNCCEFLRNNIGENPECVMILVSESKS